jgi:hypothetical protein
MRDVGAKSLYSMASTTYVREVGEFVLPGTCSLLSTLTLWSPNSCKYYLLIVPVREVEHHSSPLQR